MSYEEFYDARLVPWFINIKTHYETFVNHLDNEVLYPALKQLQEMGVQVPDFLKPYLNMQFISLFFLVVGMLLTYTVIAAFTASEGKRIGLSSSKGSLSAAAAADKLKKKKKRKGKGLLGASIDSASSSVDNLVVAAAQAADAPVVSSTNNNEEGEKENKEQVKEAIISTTTLSSESKKKKKNNKKKANKNNGNPLENVVRVMEDSESAQSLSMASDDSSLDGGAALSTTVTIGTDVNANNEAISSNPTLIESTSTLFLAKPYHLAISSLKDLDSETLDKIRKLLSTESYVMSTNTENRQPETEEWDVAGKRGESTMEKLKSRVTNLEQQLTNSEAARAKLQGILETEGLKLRSLEDVSKKFGQLSSSFENLKMENKEFVKYKMEYEKLSAAYSKVENENLSLKEEKDHLQGKITFLSECVVKLESGKENIQSAQEDLVKAVGEVKRLSGLLSTSAAEKEELQKEINSLKANETQSAQELEELRHKIASIQREFSTSKDQFLAESEVKVSHLELALNEKTGQVGNLNGLVAEKVAEITKLNAKLSDLNAELEAKESKQKAESMRLDAKISDLNAELENLKKTSTSEKADLTRVLKETEGRLVEVSKEFESMNKSKAEEIANLLKEKTELSDKLKASNADREAAQKQIVIIGNELKETLENLDKFKTDLVNLETTFKEVEVERDSLRGQVNNLKRLSFTEVKKLGSSENVTGVVDIQVPVPASSQQEHVVDVAAQKENLRAIVERAIRESEELKAQIRQSNDSDSQAELEARLAEMEANKRSSMEALSAIMREEKKASNPALSTSINEEEAGEVEGIREPEPAKEAAGQ